MDRAPAPGAPAPRGLALAPPFINQRATMRRCPEATPRHAHVATTAESHTYQAQPPHQARLKTHPYAPPAALGASAAAARPPPPFMAGAASSPAAWSSPGLCAGAAPPAGGAAAAPPSDPLPAAAPPAPRGARARRNDLGLWLLKKFCRRSCARRAAAAVSARGRRASQHPCVCGHVPALCHWDHCLQVTLRGASGYSSAGQPRLATFDSARHAALGKPACAAAAGKHRVVQPPEPVLCPRPHAPQSNPNRTLTLRIHDSTLAQQQGRAPRAPWSCRAARRRPPSPRATGWAAPTARARPAPPAPRAARR